MSNSGPSDGLDVAEDERPRLARRRFQLTPDRQGPVVLLLTFLTVSFIVGLLITEVWYRVQITQLGYEMTDLTKERQHLLDERKKLEIEATVHSRTERVDRIARDSLGLKPIHADQIIKVSSQRHAKR